MKRFAITEDLLTGIEDIDDHHRALIELGNRVVDPSAVKAEGRIIEDALKFLESYVIFHFAAEEYVMLKYGFPNVEHHRQWHEQFKSSVSGFVHQAETEGMSKDLRLKVSFAIENWMLEHIQITDQGLAKFLKQRGGAVPVRLPDVRTLKDAGKLPENFDEQLTHPAHLSCAEIG